MTSQILTPDLATARALGLKRYFTGKPCSFGHVAERAVASRACVDCALQRTRDWRGNNQKYLKTYNRKSYTENREKRILRAKEYFKKNPDKKRVYARREYERNKERYRINALIYRQANKEKLRLLARLKVLANPEQYAAYKRNRKARVRAANGSHTGEQILQLLKMQNGRCIYCRGKIAKKFHVDHIEPIIRGGSNDVTNLQLLCRPCNQSKSAKDPMKFAQERGLLL